MRYLRAMASIAAVLLLASCMGEPLKTAEGCPVFYSPNLQHLTLNCQRAFHERVAKAEGRPVQKCYPGAGGSMTCITQ